MRYRDPILEPSDIKTQKYAGKWYVPLPSLESTAGTTYSRTRGGTDPSDYTSTFQHAPVLTHAPSSSIENCSSSRSTIGIPLAFPFTRLKHTLDLDIPTTLFCVDDRTHSRRNQYYSRLLALGNLIVVRPRVKCDMFCTSTI